MTSIAGIGRLPQVTLPLGTVEGVPAGVSLLSAHGRDSFLLGTVVSLWRNFRTEAGGNS